MPSHPSDVELAQLWTLYQESATSINHLHGALENNEKQSNRLLSWNTEMKNDPEYQKLTHKQRVQKFCKQMISEFNPIHLRKEAVKKIENYRQSKGYG